MPKSDDRRLKRPFEKIILDAALEAPKYAPTQAEIRDRIKLLNKVLMRSVVLVDGGANSLILFPGDEARSQALQMITEADAKEETASEPKQSDPEHHEQEAPQGEGESLPHLRALVKDLTHVLHPKTDEHMKRQYPGISLVDAGPSFTEELLTLKAQKYIDVEIVNIKGPQTMHRMCEDYCTREKLLSVTGNTPPPRG